MAKIFSSVLAVLILSAFFQNANAQTVTVTDGINSLVWDVDQTGSNASQTLAGAVPGVDTDILFEEGWFLIVGGQVARLADTNPADISVSGNNTSSVDISYSNVQVAAAVFDIDLSYQVSTSPTGLINIALEADLDFLEGNTGPTTGSVINYFDYDIDGFSGQNAVFTGAPNPTISQLNPATDNGYARTGIDADAFDINSFATLRTSLEGGNLLDSTPNLGTIDVTGALQWNFALAPGDSFVVSGGGVGTVDGEFEAIPEPSMLGTMCFLSGMMYLRRSRRR